MRYPGKTIVPALLVLAARWSLPAAGLALEQKPLVEVKLLADTDRVVPGGKFRLGLLFRIAEGCHIYWKNPGDAGLAPEIEWKLPEGFVAGPLFWPVPERLEEPGGLFVNSYMNEVLLFSWVQAPPRLAGSTVTVGSQAGWLVCKKVCVQERTVVSVDLPVGSAAAGSESTNIFESYSGRIPKPADQVEDFSSETRWAGGISRSGARTGVVVLDADKAGTSFVGGPGELVWFAEPSEHLVCEDYHLDAANSGPERVVLHLRVRKFDDGSTWPAVWGGVLKGRLVRAAADTVNYAVSLKFTR
ncbi:MAG: protein-disulfide reductase DsbD domain-containing protein [Candidatus Glassbacteria bacterium]